VAEPHGLIVGNFLVIFGGFVNTFSGAINQTYARNVMVNNSLWRRMDDVPRPIGITHTPTVAVSSKVYLCGGYSGGTPGPHVPNCYVYDHNKRPGTGQWSKIHDLPSHGTGGAGIIYDDKTQALYYVGGAQRPFPGVLFANDTNKVWKYSLNHTELGWVASTPIPYLGNHISYVSAKDASGTRRHFLLGGQSGEDERLGNLADVYEFFPETATWIRRASMPFGRSHSTASVRAIGCGFIVAGGAINNFAGGKKLQTTDVSYYDIPTNTWTSIGNLRYAMVTPIIDIDRNGYFHFVDTRSRSYRRRIAV
jgi:hypothetical protein